MSEQDRRPMDGAELDDMLLSGLPELPPDDVAAGVTPWRRAMNRVLWGLALNAVTIDIWILGVILPALGCALMLMGFRALRRENGKMRACWVISAVRAAYMLLVVVKNATIFRLGSAVTAAVTGANIALMLALLVCLWLGLRDIRRKAGSDGGARSAGALVWWYTVVCALALADAGGWIVSIAMLIAYVIIIRRLFKLSRELDEAGYAVIPAPVRLSDRTLGWLMAAAVALGLVCGWLLLSRYPMDWRTEEVAVPAAELRQELLELGFPEDVLDDLTEEDLESCRGAAEIYSECRDQVTDDHGQNKNLRITSVAVHVTGERDDWRIFHHFRWLEAVSFYGTECVQLWTADSRISGGWYSPDGALSGRVLYDRAGVTYASPFYSLGREKYTDESMFWVTSVEKNDVFALFSMPRRGENCRGYVMYSVAEAEKGYILDSYINYVHQCWPVQYPVRTAQEDRRAGAFANGQAFYTIQDSLQAYPTEDGIRPLD